MQGQLKARGELLEPPIAHQSNWMQRVIDPQNPADWPQFVPAPRYGCPSADRSWAAEVAPKHGAWAPPTAPG